MPETDHLIEDDNQPWPFAVYPDDDTWYDLSTDDLPRITIDREANAAYIHLTDGHTSWTKQCDGYNLDLDGSGNIVGVELLTVNLTEHK
jgi:uncharacterized protein YuzE